VWQTSGPDPILDLLCGCRLRLDWESLDVAVARAEHPIAITVTGRSGIGSSN
jgi:hypothetical protein